MEPKVSIIVPVYQAEDTLRRCVNSILSQEEPDFELLLIDDGSTDASRAICDEYAAADPRVRVSHRPNMGVSAARNLALDEARGTYLQFLDSDDWLAPGATGLLLRAAEESGCDLVVADFYRVIGGRADRKGDIEEEGVLTREEYASYMMEDPADFYYGVLWNKLYRRAIVEEHRLRMNAQLSWCEDFMFNLEYIRCASSFRALREPVYYYVKTKGSLVSQSMNITTMLRVKLAAFESYHRFYKDVLDEDAYEKNRLKVYQFLIKAARDGSVPPLGARRLRESAVRPVAVTGEGGFMDRYLERRLLDRCLEDAAHRYGLTTQDARLLLALGQLQRAKDRRALADFLGLSPRSANAAVQRLAGKGLLRLEEGIGLTVSFPPKAEPILSELRGALDRYEAVRISGLAPEEAERYAALSEKVRDSVRRQVD